MSKVYICSTSRRDRSRRVLEVPTSEVARDVFQHIKRTMPGISIGVYGAKDFPTLQRTQRTLKGVKVITDIPEFMRILDETTVRQ